MATYFVVCITKHPFHTDPHVRIQYLGTSLDRSSDKATSKLTVPQVVLAIRNGHKFYCADDRGDLAEVIIARHNGHEYVKTVNDRTKLDNLLYKPECK
jgi:hypothetical protein